MDISNQEHISNAFKQCFTKIGKNLSKDIPTPANIDTQQFLKGDFHNSLFLGPTTLREIEDLTMSLKNKSCGFDNINITVVKSVISYISHIVSFLVNLFFVTGMVPDSIKVAKVIPLIKSGNKEIIIN